MNHTEHIHDEKTKCEAGTTEREWQWAILLILAPVLIILLAARFLPTTQSTHAYEPTRDLSTASTRLVGHWRSDTGDHDRYFTFDPSLDVGTYVHHNRNQRPSRPIRFKVLSEAGEQIVLRDFNKHDDLEAKIGMTITQSDIRCRIPKDGQSMSHEYRLMGSPMLQVYRYVDNITTP